MGIIVFMQEKFYKQDIETVLKSLGTSFDGLTDREAADRLKKYGLNEITEEKKVSSLELFLSQFKSFLILILLAAAAVSSLIGEIENSIMILLIVILSGILGFFQEYKADRAIGSLKKMAAPSASVVRNGKDTQIPAANIVPGDIIELHAGDGVPADSRLIQSFNLQTDEASLTGESIPVLKKAGTISAELQVAERDNMVYMGTSVSYGRGKAVATATGMDTEIGRVAGMLGSIEREKTPLQKNLDRFGRWIGTVTLAVVAAVSILGVFSGFNLVDMFIWGIALAVAAIPEALPAVVTVCLALGVKRMVKRHALIRKLQSVETLGATTVICSDKTGTLTHDEMTVIKLNVDERWIKVTGAGLELRGEFLSEGNKIEPGENEPLSRLLLICALCNDAEISTEDSLPRIKGDPTEGALLVAASKGGFHKSELEKEFSRTEEIAFSSERKMMTVIVDSPEGVFAYSKGAPEVILNSCSQIYRNKKSIELASSDQEEIYETVKEMAAEGLRVIAFSFKRLENGVITSDAAEKNMVFVGLSGMIDPPREEAIAAIATCKRAGIKTVMITGDHEITGSAIARDMGLMGKDDIVLTGAALDGMTDEELDRIIGKVSVYARVSPAHKMRIIEAFKRKGQVVAMTGDGVNDAPALRASDIGIAMGIKGTSVSKEASDMILTDDNFASIVAAVEEGRNIFKNIRNFILYGLGCHIGEVLTVLIAMLAWQALPLVALQILWINLITDGLPPMALSLELPDKSLMNRPPRRQDEGIITGRVLVYGLGVGILIALQALAIFRWSLDYEMPRARTMVFTVIVISMMFNAFNWRSERLSVFSIGFFSNRSLIYAVASTIALQILVIYTPSLNNLFGTVPLDLHDWMLVIILASTTFIAVEVAKFLELSVVRKINR